MTKELKEAAKRLCKNEDITIRRADKTNTFVLINTDKCHGKLNTILSDATKFVRKRKNPVEEIKRKLNGIIERVNAVRGSKRLSMVTGDHDLGYIYGNLKTHKHGNPLRPIISQIPSPTYAIAKALNCILASYIPSRYSLESSSEFLQLLKDRPGGGKIASLDMESLFTVLADETIQLILDRVYRGDHGSTFNIPEESLKKILQICTKEVPFINHSGQMYHQCDGVAMGSPLGVLFTNFYMGVVEEHVYPNSLFPLSIAGTLMTPLFKSMPEKT